MIHLITYADDNFVRAKKRICKEAENTGWFDTIKSYEPEDLSKEFKEKYKDILQQKRIAGYGIWRPYIISQRLKEINENDILIYLDAGCTINQCGKHRFDKYIELLNTNECGVISFQMPHIEKAYTTREIFEYFNLSLNSDNANTGQILDGILVMKKNKQLSHQIEQWNNVLNVNPLLFTDYYNGKQEKYFNDNRHEQSVFSIIRKMNNPILLNDETWFTPFGNQTSMGYPFWATRKRN